ncbi:MAG: hypothetical protein HDQ99_06015 [Lachnospiraceae bacterium]|nr:hypothetical protein [Lachnospiraceae bacterium]
MLTVTDILKYENIIDNNIIIGAPKLNGSEIEFGGKDNILFCERGVTLNNSIITFGGSNSVMYIGKNNCSLQVTVHNNSVFRLGRNTYINGRLAAICSEEKHIFIGDGCLISFGVNIRVADPHLIYDSKTSERINPSKSVFIGDHVWIGQSALLLKGSQISSGSILGANSVVAGKKVSSNTSWAGNPVKMIATDIFWDSHCVHAWTSEETARFKVFDKRDVYIYTQSEGSISFEYIDNLLTSAKTSEEKLSVLKDIAEKNDKNRFAKSCNKEYRENNSMKIFTFWEPKNKMPDYLKLCMETWKKFLPDYEIVVLDYSNIGDYIDISQYNKRLFDGTFSMPHIADAIRSMLLEKHGGIWMDTDTVLLSDDIKKFMNLDANKEVSFFGNAEIKTAHIGWINAKPHSRIMQEWVKYNMDKVENFVKPEKDFWAYLGNMFVNPYIQKNPDEVVIIDASKVMPEKSLVLSTYSPPQIYETYYFKQRLHFKDIKTTMLMLHNSWTPKVFKEMSADEFLSYDCTLSNILSEVLDKDVRKNKVYGSEDSLVKENKYILHCEDGSMIYNPTISGLNVIFTGTGGMVEIYEPAKHFEVSNITCGTGAHIVIKDSSIFQVTHGLNINARAKNSFCKIGRDFSCWNISITLIDEAGLGVEIGDDCMFSSGIELRPSDAHVIFDRKTKKKLNGGENIIIGNHVWIGKNVQINKGVVIPNNSIISSFSKVTKKFNSEYTLIGGIPAKLLKCDVDWDRTHPDLWNE